jgi:hypothetical protein
MRAVDLATIRAAVQTAEPPVSSLVGREVPLAEVAVEGMIVRHAQCTVLPV